MPENSIEVELSQFDVLFKGGKIQTYPAGTILYSPGDTTENLYILRKGKVDLYRLTNSGKRLVTRRIKPGWVFGMVGLLGQSRQYNFAEVICDSEINTIDRDHVVAILKQQPALCLSVLEVVGHRLQLLEERLLDSVYNPVIVRLAQFLLDNADKDTELLTGLTHQEIGDTIGAVRQTVTEVLGIIAKQGYILTRPMHIQVINRHGLENIIND